jgi:hypothetical protein
MENHTEMEHTTNKQTTATAMRQTCSFLYLMLMRQVELALLGKKNKEQTTKS